MPGIWAAGFYALLAGRMISAASPNQRDPNPTISGSPKPSPSSHTSMNCPRTSLTSIFLLSEAAADPKAASSAYTWQPKFLAFSFSTPPKPSCLPRNNHRSVSSCGIRQGCPTDPCAWFQLDVLADLPSELIVFLSRPQPPTWLLSNRESPI